MFLTEAFPNARRATTSSFGPLTIATAPYRPVTSTSQRWCCLCSELCPGRHLVLPRSRLRASALIALVCGKLILLSGRQGSRRGAGSRLSHGPCRHLSLLSGRGLVPLRRCSLRRLGVHRPARHLVSLDPLWRLHFGDLAFSDQKVGLPSC